MFMSYYSLLYYLNSPKKQQQSLPPDLPNKEYYRKTPLLKNTPTFMDA